MPRFVFVNKMEKERADFDRSVADLSDKFKASFVPVVIPLGIGPGLTGVVDLVDMKAWIGGKEAPIPDAAKAASDAARQKLVESAAEGDDSLIEKFFSRGHPYLGRGQQGPRQGNEVREAVPCPLRGRAHRCGHAVPPGFHHLAVPSPEGVAKGKGADGADVQRKISESEPASCFIFKTAMDQFTGKLSYFKVMSGKVSADSDLVIAREGRKEKITKVYTCLGKKLEETPELMRRGPWRVHEERHPEDE